MWIRLHWFDSRPWLRITDEALARVHVLYEERAVVAAPLELLLECETGRADATWDKPPLGIVSHVRDVSEGAFFRA